MIKFTNSFNIVGYVFSHTLEIKVSGAASKNPGTKYIRGTVNIATDDEALNIVPVDFTYVPEKLKSGDQNKTFYNLENIVRGKNNTFQEVGKQYADKIRVTGNFDVNDYLSKANGKIVSRTRLRGAFVHEARDNAACTATFDVDMIITNAGYKYFDDGTSIYSVDGYTADFRNQLIPLKLTTNEDGANCFEQYAPIQSETPLFMRLYGEFTSNVINVEKKNSDNVSMMFGAPRAEVTQRTVSRWNITAASEPFANIEPEEFKAMFDARQQVLAQIGMNAKSAPVASKKPVQENTVSAYDTDDIDF